MNREYAREQQLKAISKRLGIDLSTDRLTQNTLSEQENNETFKLPSEILSLIVEYLEVTDIIRFANTCKHFFEEIRNQKYFSNKIFRTNHIQNAFKILERLQQQDILPSALFIRDQEMLNFEITGDFPLTLSLTNCRLTTNQIRIICAHFSTIVLRNCVITCLEEHERNDIPYKASTVLLENVGAIPTFFEHNPDTIIQSVLNLFDQANTFYVHKMTNKHYYYYRHFNQLRQIELVVARSFIGKNNIIVSDQKQLQAMNDMRKWKSPRQMVILGITNWFNFPKVYGKTEVMHIDPLNITTLMKENTSLVLNDVKSLTTRLVVNNYRQYIGLEHMKTLFRVFPNLKTLTLIDTYNNNAVNDQYFKGYNSITPLSTSLKSIHFVITKEAEERKEIRTYCSFDLLQLLFPQTTIEKENIDNYRIEGIHDIAAQAPIENLKKYEKKENEIRNRFRTLIAELVILNSKASTKGFKNIVSKLSTTINSEFNEVNDTLLKNLTLIRDEVNEELKFFNDAEVNINNTYKMIRNRSDIILQDYTDYIGDDQDANKLKTLMQEFEYQFLYNNIVSHIILKNIEDLIYTMTPKLVTYPFGGWDLIHRFDHLECKNEIEITIDQDDME
jgi:hypothetical protein